MYLYVICMIILFLKLYLYKIESYLHVYSMFEKNM